VDEKPSIQAHSDTVAAIPMQPGQMERHTHDYLRHGTTDLSVALDVKAGTLIAEVHWHHRSVEFRHYLQTVGRATPVEFDLHFVLDNTSVHKSPIIQRWLLRHPRICTCRPPRPHVSTWWMLALDSYGTKAHARAVPLHSDIGERRSRSRSHPQCKPQTLRLDEDGRPGPSVRRRVLYTNF
jgi:hypothetical protein